MAERLRPLRWTPPFTACTTPALPFPCGARCEWSRSLSILSARTGLGRRPEPFQRNAAGCVKTLLKRVKSHDCRLRAPEAASWSPRGGIVGTGRASHLLRSTTRPAISRRPHDVQHWRPSADFRPAAHTRQPCSSFGSQGAARCCHLSQLPAPFRAHESSHRQACAASFPAARRLWPAIPLCGLCRRIIVRGAWCKVPRRPHPHLAGACLPRPIKGKHCSHLPPFCPTTSSRVPLPPPRILASNVLCDPSAGFRGRRFCPGQITVFVSRALSSIPPRSRRIPQSMT
jgi:hypothetical protein